MRVKTDMMRPYGERSIVIQLPIGSFYCQVLLLLSQDKLAHTVLNGFNLWIGLRVT